MSSAIDTIVDENTDSVGQFAFYRTMDHKGRLTFWACASGWTLDGMDFMLFPLVIATLVTVWGMDFATAGSISSLTLLCSAAGGWLAGYASDRIGRVKTRPGFSSPTADAEWRDSQPHKGFRRMQAAQPLPPRRGGLR
jgi:hypothetical protein